MGVSPIAATAMTGFGLIADSTNTFSSKYHYRPVRQALCNVKAG